MNRTHSTPQRRELHDRWLSSRLTYRSWLISGLGHRMAIRRALIDFFSN